MSQRTPQHKGCCSRVEAQDVVMTHKAGFSRRDLIVLQTARYFFQSFAYPQGQSWMLALDCPCAMYGEKEGARIARLVLESVQSMRHARKSCFHFNNPYCATCSQMLSDHERLFMRSFKAVQSDKAETATSYATLLCEMNPVDAFLAALSRLASATDALELETTF